MVSERLIQIWKERGMFDKLKQHGIEIDSDAQKDTHINPIITPKEDSKHNTKHKKKDLYLERKILECLGEDRYSRLSRKINDILRDYLIKQGKLKDNSDCI